MHDILQALRQPAQRAEQRESAAIALRTANLSVSNKVPRAQFAALQEWAKPLGERFAYLKNSGIPVLIIGGKSDIIFYTINSPYLEQNLPDAQLIVYPDSAHGSVFQYAELFAEHVSIFLPLPDIEVHDRRRSGRLAQRLIY
jgi:pimeloyl-ACP methyl ester carboxylesterase